MTTQHEIALMRLVAQRLVAPEDVATSAAVEGLLAVQAQDLPGALTSIALRTLGGTRQDVEAAFDARVLVRSWPMRGTLHVVMVEDLRWMLTLMTGRPMAAAQRRRGQLGLTEEDVTRAHETVLELLRGRALPRAELMEAWSELGVPTDAGRGYHLLVHLAQSGVVCQGPVLGREQGFVLVDEWVPPTPPLEVDEAVARLARRYFRGHGPATDQDLARWAGLPLRDVRVGITLAGDALDEMTVDGTRYFFDPGVPDRLRAHREEARRTLLLPGFDEMVLGYADRSATVPPEFADRIVPGGNGVFRPTVVHDGRAVGAWRTTGTGARRRVVVEPFDELPPGVEEAVPDLAAALP